MKVRIISGVVAALILLVVLVLPPLAMCIAAGALAAIGVWEAAWATGINRHKGQLIVSMLAAAVAPFLPRLYLISPVIIVAAVLCYLVAMGILQVVEHEKLRIETTGYTITMTLLVSIVFACAVIMRTAESGWLDPIGIQQNGRYLLVISLFIPWMSDIGAYFTGVCCGKHTNCAKGYDNSNLYFDDEELDRFKGKKQEEYTDEETEEFRNVLYTMRSDEVDTWVHCLQTRGIEIPQEVKDEILLMLQ